MGETIETHKKINTLARAAEIAAIVGMLILMSVFFYVTYLFFFDPSVIDSEISKEFLEKGVVANFTSGQRLVGVKLLLVTDFLGLIGICTAHNLFAGYRQGEIFTLRAASRLKTIGWIMVMLAPVWTFANTIGVSYFGSIASPGSRSFELILEDSDIYAIVFGLLIVVVGHVMYEAVRINNENKSFV